MAQRARRISDEPPARRRRRTRTCAAPPWPAACDLFAGAGRAAGFGTTSSLPGSHPPVPSAWHSVSSGFHLGTSPSRLPDACDGIRTALGLSDCSCHVGCASPTTSSFATCNRRLAHSATGWMAPDDAEISSACRARGELLEDSSMPQGLRSDHVIIARHALLRVRVHGCLLAAGAGLSYRSRGSDWRIRDST
jgi:hypothetical protein